MRTPSAATEPAPSVSRRSMLRGAAGAGAAGLAAAAVASTAAPALAAPSVGRATSGSPHAGCASAAPAGASEPVVVHLRDATSGEMDIFAGTSHTRLRDPDLAARLTRAVR